VGGTVEVYAAGTSNIAYVWDDRDKTLPTTTGRSTVTLDIYGRAEVYGSGIYKFVIKDFAGSAIETIDYAELLSTQSAVDPDVLMADFVRNVDDYDAARALTGLAAGDLLAVDHRSTVGDGGGGVFSWSTSDLSAQVTADPLRGVYLAPTSAPTGASGAWVRTESGRVDPRWYGAPSNGTVSAYSGLLGAQDSGRGVKIVGGAFLIDSAFTLSGDYQFSGGGVLKWGVGTVVTFDRPNIFAGKVKIFDVTPDWAEDVVANTSVTHRYAQNVVGPNYGEWMHGEWFGAVPAVAGVPVDSFDALTMAHQVGNLRLSDLHYISRQFLVINNKEVAGSGGRPSLYGFVVSPTLIAFTGTRGITNFEDTGMTSATSANGLNQNPYVGLDDFMIRSEGVDDATYTPFHWLNYEGSDIVKVISHVIPYGAVTVPSVKNLGQFRYGPVEIRNCEILTTGTTTIADDYAWQATEMTGMTISGMNYVGLVAKPCHFQAFTQSVVSTLNHEAHPSESGAAVTVASIVGKGPVRFESGNMSTKDSGCAGFEFRFALASSYDSRPTVYDFRTANHPSDGTGLACFGTPIRVVEEASTVAPAEYDKDYLFGAGFTQGAASLYGISSFTESEAKFWGGEKKLINNVKRQDSCSRNVGAIGIGGSITVPLPRLLNNYTLGYGVVHGMIQISARASDYSDVGYFSAYNMIGNGSASGLFYNTEIVGAANFSVTNDLATQLMTITNDSGLALDDAIVSISYYSGLQL
jgi:hypothetical protein